MPRSFLLLLYLLLEIYNMDKNTHISPISRNTGPGEETSLLPIYYSPADKSTLLKSKFGTSTPGPHGSQVFKRRSLHKLGRQFQKQLIYAECTQTYV